MVRPANGNVMAWEVRKVLIADDHALIRQGLKAILHETQTATHISEATDGDEAAAKALTGDWDVIVLDISMPGQSGLEVLKQVKRERPELPVLMLSTHGGQQYVLRSLRAGANGYLSKESAPEELVTAIETVLAGGVYISRSLRHMARPS